ncbi:MAG: CHASE domain-containing protein [Gammaproteobacteria bacterium]|nr:CHASE domain-containing protein [Gammaproteobacteria bacterium]
MNIKVVIIPWIIKIIVITAIYCILAALCLNINIPFSYATLPWLPVGLALGVLLIYGYSACAAAFLGQFLISLYTFSNASIPLWLLVLAASVIACGTALQVGVAGYWIQRRYVETPAYLQSERQLAWLMLVCAPVTCLISAAFGTFGLYLAEALHGKDWFYTAITWWFGDSLGIAIVTPLILMLFDKRVQRYHKAAVVLATSIVFVAVILLFQAVNSRNQTRESVLFQQWSQQVASVLERQLDLYLEHVSAVASFYNASDQVTADEFKVFTDSFVTKYRGIQVLNWVPFVRFEQRREYERRRQMEGVTDFVIWQFNEKGNREISHKQPYYAPLYFTNSALDTSATLGFDVLSDKRRSRALLRAATTREVIISEKVQRVLNPNESAVLVFKAIYKGSSTVSRIKPALPDSYFPAKDFQGFVVGAFYLKDTFAPVIELLKEHNLVLTITDAENAEFIFNSTEYVKNQPVVFSSGYLINHKKLSVANRAWILTTKQARVWSENTLEAWGILLVGLVFTVVWVYVLLVFIVQGLIRNSYSNSLAENNEKLQQLVSGLEQSNNQLERFAYISSHDMQEPLRTVGMYADILAEHLDGNLDADAKRYIGFIVKAARRSRDMIEDVLIYAKLKSVQDFSAIDMQKLMYDVIDSMRLIVQERLAIITFENLPVVAGNTTQVGRVLLNLINNAIKFCPHKNPVIKITASPLSLSHFENKKAMKYWQFAITDNGIGIRQQDFAKIFAIFARLHGRDEFAGTGIGLALCKKIIENHGGKMWVESEYGKGSTFFFTLPQHT